MRTVEEHLTHCLEGRAPLAPIELQLLEAQGGLLAESVSAPSDLPGFDAADVDGYAVRSADVASATSGNPIKLPVVGDVSAGSSGILSVPAGSAARIRVGEPLPTGADAVIPSTHTDGGLRAARVLRSVESRANVRRRGAQVRAGEVLLETGTRLGPAHIALLAALGRDRVLVRPRPRVVVLSVGADLVEPGQPVSIGQHADAASYLLTSSIRESGAIAYRVGIVPDDARRLADAVEDQLIRADLVIATAGGHERSQALLREVLTRLGRVTFDRVAMRPGPGQGYGVIGADSTPIFTLPDDPIGTAVSFEVFVRPVIRRMLGAEPIHRPAINAVLTSELQSDQGVRDFVCARLAVEEGRYVATPMVDRNGGAPPGHPIARLLEADAFVAVPEQSSWMSIGDPAAVMVLERRRG